jgi:hypothetical protein
VPSEGEYRNCVGGLNAGFKLVSWATPFAYGIHRPVDASALVLRQEPFESSKAMVTSQQGVPLLGY